LPWLLFLQQPLVAQDEKVEANVANNSTQLMVSEFFRIKLIAGEVLQKI